MRLSELWRTTTARITLVYGLVFALGVPALLATVYLQSEIYLSGRVDRILDAQADALENSLPADLPQRVDESLVLNGPRFTLFGLFSADGRRLAGNVRAIPPGLKPDGTPLELAPSADFPVHAQMILRRLPSGDVLLVGRDAEQMVEMRAIMASASVWTGVAILLAGLGCGVALSIRPLRRLRSMQAAAQDIATGNLKRRMPVSRRGDELDIFAEAVNFMMSEVERLMNEVKGSTETIAHDLRTPLTRARAQLHRLQQAPAVSAAEIGRVADEIDTVLERFRALLRISEIEARERRAGFSTVDLSDIARQVVDLYGPLAEIHGVRLQLGPIPSAEVLADEKLLFEAASNLVDNAIKFTATRGDGGGLVEIGVGPPDEGPILTVRDNGPGIPAHERAAVVQRFYRSEDQRLTAGSGLGLSIVTAILRLHHFNLELQDAAPGLRAVIRCSPSAKGSSAESET